MMKWIKGSVLVCAVVAVLGVASHASAGKKEGPPPAGFQDIGPAVVGSLTFTSANDGVLVDVSCKGTPIMFSIPLTYTIDTLTEKGLTTGIEGYEFLIEGLNITDDMRHCYPDLGSSLLMAVNTVTKFKVSPAIGPRTTLIADVVLMRRIAK